MNLFRSILFALFFYSGTLIVVLLAFPVAFFSSKLLSHIIYGWAFYHRRCVALFLGIRSHVVGQPAHGAAIIAIKHQSMFETIEILLLFDNPAVVLKQQLAAIPGWGWVARRFGVIPIDREGGAIALKHMLKAAQAAIAVGRPIVIFPEGTRVLPGEKPPLQSGFAGLYRLLNVPVVPIAVDSGRIWPRHHFIKHPGVITMRIGETILPGLPRKEVEARVHAAINSLEP